MSDSTKRLTAEEVAAECERLAGASDFTLTRVAFLEAARLIREHLVPQWQDEPSGDGWYWVEGNTQPCYVLSLSSGWWFSFSSAPSRPLDGRRVCPVSPPPPARTEAEKWASAERTAQAEIDSDPPQENQ